MTYMNRMGNMRNPYQTDTKKVLCLCSAGLLRSPTMANVLHQEFGYNTRAAGVTEEYALIFCDSVLRSWADEIVFAEKNIYQQYKSRWEEDDKRSIVLAIPDEYEWNDPELRGLILKQYKDSAIMETAFHNENSSSV